MIRLPIYLSSRNASLVVSKSQRVETCIYGNPEARFSEKR